MYMLLCILLNIQIVFCSINITEEQTPVKKCVQNLINHLISPDHVVLYAYSKNNKFLPDMIQNPKITIDMEKKIFNTKNYEIFMQMIILDVMHLNVLGDYFIKMNKNNLVYNRASPRQRYLIIVRNTNIEELKYVFHYLFQREIIDVMIMTYNHYSNNTLIRLFKINPYNPANKCGKVIAALEKYTCDTIKTVRSPRILDKYGNCTLTYFISGPALLIKNLTERNYILDFLTNIITKTLNLTLSPTKTKYNYWDSLGVPCIEPSIPFGTMENPFKLKRSFTELIKDQYNEAKSKGYKHVGLYGVIRPQYMPIDVAIIKNIMIKDFNYFVDRGFYSNEKEDPLSAHLFNLQGQKWKNIRAKLTPTFSSAKMKIMFDVIVKCAQQMSSLLEDKCQIGPIAIKESIEFFSTDVIGSCAFGINCNSFLDPFSSFSKIAKRIFKPTVCENLKHFISFIGPSIATTLKWKLIPADVSSFFLKMVNESVEYRKNNEVKRKDFLEILINMMKDDKKGEETSLSINEVTAHSFVFFIAGFETSSTTITFSLFELAQNYVMQQMVRTEVKEISARYNNQITYESLKEMTYLDQVVKEVLRKYPPLPMLNRICISDYKVPGTDLVIKEGTPVIIPLCGLQHDPEYFPDPEKFDPERFNASNNVNIAPCTYMPFGEGPRFCIGYRFAMIQTKLALATLLRDFQFSLDQNVELPLKLNPISFILSPKDEIWMNVKKLIH
ncbi:hypothetical protein FQA39_LY16915 [Lamprigera yunnana]|nr:hypothetical protein FQA39_LY16915 [Lamprigera yunnana]